MATIQSIALSLQHSRSFLEPAVNETISGVVDHLTSGPDIKRWNLSANGNFSVKSFYSFLNDGGVRCPVTPKIWRGTCPRKVNMFNWLVWDNRVLTMVNLAKRRCNPLPTATCVLCHAEEETVEHLFFTCPFAARIWAFLGQNFSSPSPPLSAKDLWGPWRRSIERNLKEIWDLLSRALTWNIWLERNQRIFKGSCMSTHCISAKILNMTLCWISAAPAAKSARLMDATPTVKQSLAFLGARTGGSSDPSEGSDPVSPDAG